MEAGQGVRAQWVKPVVVQKAINETRAGKGLVNDGGFEQQS